MLYIKNQTKGSESLNQVEEKEVKEVVDEAFFSDTAIQVLAGALFLLNVKREVIVLLHMCENVLGFSLETQEEELCNRINRESIINLNCAAWLQNELQKCDAAVLWYKRGVNK